MDSPVFATLNRLIPLLAILLTVDPVLADPQHYPFKLAMRAAADGQVVMAQNSGPAPILATVNLHHPENATVDHPSPIVVIVKPQQSLPVASVHRELPGKPYRIASAYQYALGDPDAVHDPAAIYQLPFQDGQTIRIGQSYGGHITTHHNPDSRYAVDFIVPVGTPVLASRAGRVVDIDQEYTLGGNDPALKANHVLILHEDGTLGMYSHLAMHRISVSFGQPVAAGDLLGYSGNTGYSSGPHLHFAVLINTRTPDGSAKYVSVPANFVNGADGHPLRFAQSDTVTVTGLRKLSH